MDSEDLPNDFAHLSTDIIFDVVKTEAPAVRDLDRFAKLTGSWADIVKSDDVFKTDYYDEKGSKPYGKSYIGDNGYQKKYTHKSPGNYKLENVSVNLVRSSSCVGRLENALSECMGKVSLRFHRGLYSITMSEDVSPRQLEHFNYALKLLLERPITQLILIGGYALHKVNRSGLLKSRNGDVILETFRSLITKPKLQSLKIDCNRLYDEEVEQCLLEFVKKPNFLRLKAPLSSTFLPKLLDYWLNLTTFPPYVQTVVYGFSYYEKVAIDFEGLHFQLERRNKEVRETYFRKHPNSEYRRIEISQHVPRSCNMFNRQIISVRLV